MKKYIVILLVLTHCLVGFFGFGAGIYALPIIIAPTPPSDSEINLLSSEAKFTATFQRDLKDSDALHWGDGNIAISSSFITFIGELAPGPDYKLYLSPEFVETESDFHRLKSNMVRVGDVDSFNNFVVAVRPDIELSNFNTVIIWCESFNQFITSAKYR
jgi:hypothetical protein